MFAIVILDNGNYDYLQSIDYIDKEINIDYDLMFIVFHYKNGKTISYNSFFVSNILLSKKPLIFKDVKVL